MLFEKVSKCGTEELSSVRKCKKAGMCLWENILLDELCLGFPGVSVGKESACTAGDLGSIPGFNPWVLKIPWRRKWQPTPVFLPGKSHGQRSLVGYSPGDHKCQT